jgi:hypothetical protein
VSGPRRHLLRIHSVRCHLPRSFASSGARDGPASAPLPGPLNQCDHPQSYRVGLAEALRRPSLPVTPTSVLLPPSYVIPGSLPRCASPPSLSTPTLHRTHRPWFDLYLVPLSIPGLQTIESPSAERNRLASDMSSSNSDPTGKQKRRSVKKLERCQGFDFPNGLSLISRAIRERAGPIGNFYESLKSLHEMRDISPPELKGEARILFDELGPQLWPQDTSTAWWLLKPPHSDYPRHLYYEDREDREQYVPSKLRTSLLLLMIITDSGVTS